MAANGRLEALVDNIFAENNKINGQKLKEFLKLISFRVKNVYIDNEAVPPEGGGEEEEEEQNQVKYLDTLIEACEERLAKLEETPKTKIIIRNEGEKLQLIIDELQCSKANNARLQEQIDTLVKSHEKILKLECQKRQHYQDMIDRLYTDSINSDICVLRRMFYSIQNRVDELVVKCDTMKNSIADIEKKIVALDMIPCLDKRVQSLLDWRASLREEFELFAERYEHVKTVKASKCEVEDMLLEKVSYNHLSRYVQNTTFDLARKDFAHECDQLKEVICEFQLAFNAKLASMHRDVQSVLSKLATKRRMEK